MRLRVCVRMPEVVRMERRVTLSKATSAATVMSVMSVTDAKLVSRILKLMSRKDFLPNMREFAFIICIHARTCKIQIRSVSNRTYPNILTMMKSPGKR